MGVMEIAEKLLKGEVRISDIRDLEKDELWSIISFLLGSAKTYKELYYELLAKNYQRI